MEDVAKIRMRFTEVAIRHTACMGYILQGDFDLHFRDKTFSCYAFSIKIAQATDITSRFFSTAHGPPWSCSYFLYLSMLWTRVGFKYYKKLAFSRSKGYHIMYRNCKHYDVYREYFYIIKIDDSGINAWFFVHLILKILLLS